MKIWKVKTENLRIWKFKISQIWKFEQLGKSKSHDWKTKNLRIIIWKSEMQKISWIWKTEQFEKSKSHDWKSENLELRIWKSRNQKRHKSGQLRRPKSHKIPRAFATLVSLTNVGSFLMRNWLFKGSYQGLSQNWQNQLNLTWIDWNWPKFS